MDKLTDLILARPKWVLGLFVLALLALAPQIRHFKIDASADTLLTKNNELYIKTQQMGQRFAPQEFLLIGYQPTQQSIFSEQTFSDIKSISEGLLKLERVESVRSILNVPLLTLMDGDLTSADTAEWTIERKSFSQEQLRETFRGHPIYEELVINEEQTATAMQVLFKPNEELTNLRGKITEIQQNALERDLTEEEEARIEALQRQAEPLEQALGNTRSEEIRHIRQLIAGYDDRANIYLGGAHVVGQQLIEIIRSDLVIFGGAIFALICMVLLLLFQRFRWLLIPIVSCAVSVALTMGLFGLLGLKTTVISANFVALQLILTLAIVIHLIVQYREYNRREPEWQQSELVRKTLRRKLAPCFFAALTTCVGFASLLITDIQPVVSFGWMMIIALAFSTITSLLLFPALMELFPKDQIRGDRATSRYLLDLFSRLARNHGGAVAILSVFALLLAAAGTTRLEVENSFINYFADDTQVHRELSFIDQELGGSTPLDLTLTIPSAQQTDGEPILSAETVQLMQRIQKMFNEQEGMGKVLSVVNVTELAMQINDGKPLTEYELTAVYRMISDDLRDDLVGSFYSEENQQLRLSARVKDSTPDLDRAALIENIRTGMNELGVGEENYELTSLFVLYQDILERLYRSQILALGLVYLALTLMFVVIFRSLRIALVGVAPNILTTVSVLGIMGWLNMPLDLMTITIASIAMGIAVDDTIHYIHRYREEIAGADPKEAIQQTHLSVGFAVLYTSLVVILGFSALAFSNFLPSVHFGLLTGLAMIMALAWNLSLLPVLLKRFVAS